MTPRVTSPTPSIDCVCGRLRQPSPRATLLALLLLVSCVASQPAQAARDLALRGAAPDRLRVVIDPGHGGSDDGAVVWTGTPRRAVAEKDVTLALAKAAARALRDQGIETLLTRTADQELALRQRTDFANRARADLFISLHLNSGQDPHAQGAETYFLSSATDAASRRIQELENQGNGVTLAAAQPHSPPGSDVALILKDLQLDANLGASQAIACELQSEVARSAAIRNRGVKQALFYVLLGADMPAVLLEAGFLTHAAERARLLSPVGQVQIGQAISRAVLRYQARARLSRPDGVRAQAADELTPVSLRALKPRAARRASLQAQANCQNSTHSLSLVRTR